MFFVLNNRQKIYQFVFKFGEKENFRRNSNYKMNIYSTLSKVCENVHYIVPLIH